MIKLFTKYQSNRLAHIIITSDDNDQVDLKLKTIQYMARECVNLQTFNCAHVQILICLNIRFGESLYLD